MSREEPRFPGLWRAYRTATYTGNPGALYDFARDAMTLLEEQLEHHANTYDGEPMSLSEASLLERMRALVNRASASQAPEVKP